MPACTPFVGSATLRRMNSPAYLVALARGFENLAPIHAAVGDEDCDSSSDCGSEASQDYAFTSALTSPNSSSSSSSSSGKSPSPSPPPRAPRPGRTAFDQRKAEKRGHSLESVIRRIRFGHEAWQEFQAQQEREAQATHIPLRAAPPTPAPLPTPPLTRLRKNIRAGRAMPAPRSRKAPAPKSKKKKGSPNARTQKRAAAPLPIETLASAPTSPKPVTGRAASQRGEETPPPFNPCTPEAAVQEQASAQLIAAAQAHARDQCPTAARAAEPAQHASHPAEGAEKRAGEGESNRDATPSPGAAADAPMQQEEITAAPAKPRTTEESGSAPPASPSKEPASSPRRAPAGEEPAPSSPPQGRSRPPDDDGFRGQGRNQKKQNTARTPALSSGAATNGAAAHTILFRPLARRGNLAEVSRFAVEKELAHIPALTACRVNHRLNTVAVDTTSERSREALLAVHTLCGTEVRAQPARGSRNARGVLRDIDLPHTLADIMTNLTESPVPILHAHRKDTSVFLTFDGPTAPAAVHVAGVRCRVQHLPPRPLQCENCGRYNHYTSACRSAPRCKNCGGDHATSSCVEHTQRCANCGGAHHFSSPRCRLWRREKQIASHAASLELPLSEARKRYFKRPAPPLVLNEERTYSQALRGRDSRRQIPATPQARVAAPSAPTTNLAVAAVLSEATKALNAAIDLLKNNGSG